MLGQATFVLAGLAVGAGPAVDIDDAAGIRSLSVSQAAERRPASVQGVVTFAHQAWFGAYGFVQDDSAGIYFPIPEDGPELRPGHLVRVSGVTQPGDFAPILKAQRVEVLGRTPLPTPIDATIAEMFDGHFDSQWVRTRGRARLAGEDAPADVRTLDIVSNGHRLRIDLFASVDPARLDALWGAEVEVTGVCATIFNERRQLIGVRMMVETLEQVRVIPDSTLDPFDVTPIRIDEVLRFHARSAESGGLARVLGVVTHREPGGAFTIQDDTGGIRVLARLVPQLGQQVDVVGFAEAAGLTPRLRDSVYRATEAEVVVTPIPTPADRLLSVEYANRLVTAEVVLLDRFDGDDEIVLSTMHGDDILHAILPFNDPTGVLPDVESGSRLRLTGVVHLLQSPAEIRRHPNSFAISPSSAQLRLRGFRDVQVIEPAPYWTTERTQLALGGLIICLVAGMSWVRVLRRRVSEQTSVIRRQLDREKTLTKEAEAANRAKSAFLANISHELRTPMNGVLGVADLLCADRGVDPARRDLLEIIRKSSNQLLELLGNLLDFSKIEAGGLTLEPRSVPLRSVIRDTASLVRQQARDKGLQVDTHISVECPRWVEIDPTRLAQVILNLLTNAVKFTEQGRVSVEVTYALPNRLRVEVADTGIGLTPEARTRLFQRFSQADASIGRRYGGTGLGLAICRGLVEEMGGEIGVDSEAGQGSRFWFTCEAPEVAAPPEVSTLPAARSPQDAQRISARRVLLVDDNPVNLKVGERMLSQLGVRVDTASGGEQALRALRGVRYDVVFMDLHMPSMDGLTCTRVIRDTLPAEQQPYILALTADAASDARTACLAAGMDDHLAKPLTMKALSAALDCALAALPSIELKRVG